MGDWNAFIEDKFVSSTEATELGSELAPLVQSFSINRKPSSVVFGLSELDDYTLGLFPGEMTVIAGRPGMGKSALALDVILANAAANNPYFFSLEMSRPVVVDRLVCNLADVNLHRLRLGQLTAAETQAVKAALQGLSKYKAWVDDSAVLNTRILERKLARARDLGCKLAVIDYFQIMSDGVSTEASAASACKTAGAIRAVAKTLQIPIIVLSQLNRSVENRVGERNQAAKPKASDLYGGGLEQAADAVHIIYRPQPSSPDVTIIVAKNRNGPTGEIHCKWCPEFTSFRDYEPGEL